MKEFEEIRLVKITAILNSVWQNEKAPSDWKRGVIIRIPTKGNNLRKRSNWRIITLLLVPGKPPSNITHARIKDEPQECGAR